MIDKSILPAHWEVKKLGEVAKYLNGRAFKPTEWKQTGKPIIRIQNLNKPDAAYNYTDQEFETRYRVENGDLLFAWSASLGAYIWKGIDAWLNQHIFKVVPVEGTDKLYLFYLLEKITQELYAKAHGSGMVHVTKGKFEATEIPLPPLSQQQEIVAKIEELFSELDKGKEQLETARQQLKVYRQAVLKWAFEGRFTNSEVKYGELPESWVWVRPEDVASQEKYSIGIGPFGSNLKTIDYTTEGVPLIFVKNITRDNFDLDQRFISLEKFDELYAHQVQPGDILITKMGNPPGDCTIYPINRPEAVLTADCLKLRINKERANTNFIKYIMQTQVVKKQIEAATMGVAQKKISVERFKKLIFPLPTLEEQNLIVQEIESRLSVCDKVEETINKSLLQAETLRQSLLKQAFEGKLI